MRTWVLNTNDSDYKELIATARASGDTVTTAWTVDRRVQRGDRFALHGKSPNLEFGFLGCAASDAVKSTDGNWWSWVAFVACAPVPLRNAKSDPVFGEWGSLKMMRWACRHVADDKQWLALRNLLLAHSRDAEDTSKRWDRRDLPAAGPSLRHARRAHANTDGSGTLRELSIQPLVGQALIADGTARDIRPADELKFSKGLQLGSAGFADILLVARQQPRTLLVIEVKRAAKPGAATDGVTQLSEDYVPWLQRQAFR